MGHHKRKRPKNRRAGCILCKPHKMNGVRKRGLVVHIRGTRNGGVALQEHRAALGEAEQRSELGLVLCPGCNDRGCVWCGYRCPVDEHVVVPSDLEGTRWVGCSRCGADGEVVNGKVEW